MELARGPGGGGHVGDLTLHAVAALVPFLDVEADHGLAGLDVEELAVGADDAVATAEAIAERPRRREEEAHEDARYPLTDGRRLQGFGEVGGQQRGRLEREVLRVSGSMAAVER